MQKQNTGTGKTFFSGVFLLTLSTLSVKLIGMIYKIPMLAYLGSEGMGYFHSAYEIYAILCIVATAGLPVALSVLISGALARGERDEVRRIYRAAWFLFFALGTAGSLGMYFFSGRFSSWLHSEGALLCIRAISPTVLLICLSSALRGYFQGYSRMLPTAVSQVIEAAGKLGFGLWFATSALRRGASIPAVAAAAGWGLTVGTLLSLLYLCAEKWRMDAAIHHRTLTEHSPLPHTSRKSVYRTLLRLALPMTLSAGLLGMTRLLDMALILRRLWSIGMSEEAANAAYGGYTTLALSVFGLLPSLIQSITLPLLPVLSGTIATGDREGQSQLIATSFRWTALTAIPAALGLTAFARPILLLLFGYDRAAVEIAAPLLSALGISVFLSCMITATSAVLHAYRVVRRPLLSIAAGLLVKALTAYVLIGMPSVGLLGAPISTFFGSATIVLCNLYICDAACPLQGMREQMLRPLTASVGTVGVGYAAYAVLVHFRGEHAGITLSAIALTVLLYVLAACRWGAVRREDLLAMPGGERICRLLEACRLLRRPKTKPPRRDDCDVGGDRIK